MAWTAEARKRSIEVRRLRALMKRRLSLRNARTNLTAPTPLHNQQIGALAARMRVQQNAVPFDFFTDEKKDQIRNVAVQWRPGVTASLENMVTGYDGEDALRNLPGALPGCSVVAMYAPENECIYVGAELTGLLSQLNNPNVDLNAQSKRMTVQACESVFHEVVHSMHSLSVSKDEYAKQMFDMCYDPAAMAIDEGFTEAYAKRLYPEFMEKVGAGARAPEIKNVPMAFDVYPEFVDAAEFLAFKLQDALPAGFTADSIIEHMAVKVEPIERFNWLARLLKGAKQPELQGLQEKDMAQGLKEAFRELMLGVEAGNGIQKPESFDAIYARAMARRLAYRQAHPIEGLGA